jgi:hypothetical protein
MVVPLAIEPSPCPHPTISVGSRCLAAARLSLVTGALLRGVERLRENDGDEIPDPRFWCGRDAAVFGLDTADRCVKADRALFRHGL